MTMYSIKGKTVETKNFPFQLKSINEDEGTVTGHLSTFGNVDLQKDRVIKGAFKKTLSDAYSRKKNGRKFLVPDLWMHDPDKPTGGVIEASEDGEGLLVTMQYDITTNAAGIPNNPVATMVFSGHKMGYIDELSMGYVAVQKEFDGGVRNLKEVQLIECSAVTMLFAANPEAQISGVKTMGTTTEKPVGRKDFNDLFTSAMAADCLEDWGDLINTLTQAMLQLFTIGDTPATDMKNCLEQFNAAVTAWTEKGVECNLSQYISDQGYCGQGTPYVPYSLRAGSDYGSMSRSSPLQGSKAGATISAATQGTLQAHQEAMKASLDVMQEHCKSMQQKVSDLTQLWEDTDRGEPYGNDKSHVSRHEPPQTLVRRDAQPLHKSTVDDEVVAELEALFN